METKDSKKGPQKSDIKYHLTPEGSLGLLAYGDLGLIAWREVKSKLKKEPNSTTNE